MKAEIYTTCGCGSQNQCGQESVVFKEDMQGTEAHVINIYPEAEFEKFESFGGAVTDSAAYVYSLMDEKQKAEVIQMYFKNTQMKYEVVRIHMDSCDFSTEMYEAMSDEADTKLKSFTFKRTEKYIIPMLADAQKAAGKPLRLMLSPWSPPAFMKSNHARTQGGCLKEKYFGLWAEYICRYIEEFQKRGFEVQRISLQNEPKAVQTWDSCVYSSEQEKRFLSDYMYPALLKHGMEEIEIFIWDHNKERVYERVREVVDKQTEKMISGVAFHWYSGDHFEALQLIRKQYPYLKLITSESCIEYSKFGSDEQWKNAARLSHEIIGDLNNGMTAFYDWNLLLDSKGGPNHVGNYCQAPYLYDMKKKELLPQLIQKHFYHFSHYIEHGAMRTGFSKYTDALDVTVFKNPNGQLIFIILNRTQENLPVVLRLNGKISEMTVWAESICTGVIEDKEEV